MTTVVPMEPSKSMSLQHAPYSTDNSPRFSCVHDSEFGNYTVERYGLGVVEYAVKDCASFEVPGSRIMVGWGEGSNCIIPKGRARLNSLLRYPCYFVRYY